MTNVPQWLRDFFGNGNLLKLDRLLDNVENAYPADLKPYYCRFTRARLMLSGHSFCPGVMLIAGYFCRGRYSSHHAGTQQCVECQAGVCRCYC